MNSKKGIDTEERTRESIKLENVSEENMQNITSCKSKLETIMENITLNKNLVQHYENKLQELFTDIANVQWKQTKAKTYLESYNQFVENFKSNYFNTEPTKKTIQEEAVSNIINLKQEKENLEKFCNANYRIIEELSNEYQKLKEDCNMYKENKDDL